MHIKFYFGFIWTNHKHQDQWWNSKQHQQSIVWSVRRNERYNNHHKTSICNLLTSWIFFASSGCIQNKVFLPIKFCRLSWACSKDKFNNNILHMLSFLRFKSQPTKTINRDGRKIYKNPVVSSMQEIFNSQHDSNYVRENQILSIYQFHMWMSRCTLCNQKRGGKTKVFHQ